MRYPHVVNYDKLYKAIGFDLENYVVSSYNLKCIDDDNVGIKYEDRDKTAICLYLPHSASKSISDEDFIKAFEEQIATEDNDCVLYVILSEYCNTSIIRKLEEKNILVNEVSYFSIDVIMNHYSDTKIIVPTNMNLMLPTRSVIKL